jgi:hypothetical protein
MWNVGQGCGKCEQGHHLMKPTGEVRQLKGRKRQSVVITELKYLPIKVISLTTRLRAVTDDLYLLS